MATALFINRTDLVRNSIIDGNVDTDKFIQFIKIAQQIHIQNYLGTELYNKIGTLITSGDIDEAEYADYKTLLNDYIQPMLIWWSQVDYIPFASYQIRNGGIYKHSSETSESVGKDEVDFLVNKAREEGKIAFRTAGSHSPIDVCVIDTKNLTIKLIQCKTGKKLTQHSLKPLRNALSKHDGVYIVHWKVAIK